MSTWCFFGDQEHDFFVGVASLHNIPIIPGGAQVNSAADGIKMPADQSAHEMKGVDYSLLRSIDGSPVMVSNPSTSWSYLPLVESGAYIHKPRGFNTASSLLFSTIISWTFVHQSLSSWPAIPCRDTIRSYNNSATSTKPRHSFTSSSPTSFAGTLIRTFFQTYKVRVWCRSSSIWTVYVSKSPFSVLCLKSV
jgi:hypothetical protein